MLPCANTGMWMNTTKDIVYIKTQYSYGVLLFYILLVRPANTLVSVTQSKQHHEPPWWLSDRITKQSFTLMLSFPSGHFRRYYLAKY